MSISKEIFGIEREQVRHPEITLSPQQESINKTLDKIDEHELSEQELLEVLVMAEDAYINAFVDNNLSGLTRRQFLVKFIKQNLHRIFVRKSK